MRYSDPSRIANNLIGQIDDLVGQSRRGDWHCGAVTSSDPILSGDDYPDYGPPVMSMEAENHDVALAAVSIMVNSGVDGGFRAAGDATHVYIMPKGPGFSDWLNRRNRATRGSATKRPATKYPATPASQLITGSNQDNFKDHR